MLLRDLTEIWVSEYEEINDHGEKDKKWKYKPLDTKSKTAFLNLQQDINELDKKSTGEVDYSIVNARTDVEYNIEKGNGVSFIDISKQEEFKPNYTVTDKIKIGKSTLYKLEKVQ